MKRQEINHQPGERGVTEILFRCENCDTEVERDILPSKHSVRGAALRLSRNQDCCDDPSYVDSSGHIGPPGFVYRQG